MHFQRHHGTKGSRALSMRRYVPVRADRSRLIDDCVARTQVDAFPRIRRVCHSRRGLGAFRELAFSALPHLVLTDQLRSLGLWRTPMDLRMSKRGILISQRTSPIYLRTLLPAHLYTSRPQGNVTATSVL